MTHWIFKQSEQDQYPDRPGETYVYDNRHSVRVAAGDSLVYLDKRFGGYGFTGHGVVTRVRTRIPGNTEQHHTRMGHVYTADIGDYVPYARALDIRSSSPSGKRNRALLGITDANKLGWSRSIARISPSMYMQIVELAYQLRCIAVVPPDASDYVVPDAWSFEKRRHNLERFKEAVLSRQGYACAICGTKLKAVLDVAHISRYSTDVNNRANPANGIGLCAYCHRAFDGGAFILNEDGIVLTGEGVESDWVARAHISSLSAEARSERLNGIDTELLRRRNSLWPWTRGRGHP